MNHIIVKVIILFVLFLVTLLTGLIPFFIDGRVKRTRRARRRITVYSSGYQRARILSYCNCFAGGVFLATCLLDLLPMVQEKYKDSFSQAHIETVFPIAEFTTCVGLFIILFVEQAVHYCHERSGTRHPFFHSHKDEDVYAPLLKDSVHDIDSVSTVGNKNGTEQNSFNTPSERTNNSHNSAQPGRSDEEEESGTLRAYILIVALSLHSLFEGLALGLIQEVDRLTQVAVAVVIHKTLIAFSLGISMVQHRMSFSAIATSCLLFSIMGPVGVGAGIAVIQSSTTFEAAMLSAVLQGVANGSFLFVTFFEIFHKELTHPKGNRLLKVLFMIIGFSVVTGLLYYANIKEHASDKIKPKMSGNGTMSEVSFVR